MAHLRIWKLFFSRNSPKEMKRGRVGLIAPSRYMDWFAESNVQRGHADKTNSENPTNHTCCENGSCWSSLFFETKGNVFMNITWNPTDWRDHFEEKDSDGDPILELVLYESKILGYIFKQRDSGVIGVATNIMKLVPKKPKPCYRPWTMDEVPIGNIVRRKDGLGKNPIRIMITGSKRNHCLYGTH